ncbi:MAG: hypothetical protein ACI9U2_000170 [Bradymonadia bacterium]|jgi:hypothetical protein
MSRSLPFPRLKWLRLPSRLALLLALLIGCAPDRAADDPITQAGLAALQAPPARGVLDFASGLARGLQQMTVIRAEVSSAQGLHSDLRDLQTAVMDAQGNARLDTWGITRAPAPVEDGRSCVEIDGRIYTQWRTRKPELLRRETAPGTCVGTPALAEMLGRFAAELDTTIDGDRVEFRLRDRARPGPDAIALTWPDGPQRPRLHAPRLLHLVSHARPTVFIGHATRDAEGRLRAGHLEARFDLRKGGQDATMRLSIDTRSAPFAGRIEAPLDPAIETPRPRALANIEAVLGPRPATIGTLPGPGDAPPLRLRPQQPSHDPGDAR